MGDTFAESPCPRVAASDGLSRGCVVQIRPAAYADLPRLMELLFHLSELGELPEDRPRSAGPAEREGLHRLTSDPGSTCYVLEVDGQVEGTLTLYVLSNLSHGGRPFAIVESVVVDERAQGFGYGRLLMERAEALARAAGCYKIALTSNRKRADAHRFYEGLGYAPTHQGFTKYFDREPPSVPSPLAGES